MQDWLDRMTLGITYACSLFGIFISSMSLEQWYFLSSSVIGLIALVVNIWHKRVMQRIAREKGVSIYGKF